MSDFFEHLLLLCRTNEELNSTLATFESSKQNVLKELTQSDTHATSFFTQVSKYANFLVDELQHCRVLWSKKFSAAVAITTVSTVGF